MKNILTESVRRELTARVNNLSENDKALFGKMNCHQMICHSTDQIRMAIGEIKTGYIGNALTSTLLKYLILAGMPAPKGRIETVKELKQGAGGTKPVNFEADKKILSGLIDRFCVLYNSQNRIVHPAFGAMNKAQWGRLVYIHADYHLKQFGK
jgi:hypothetical protein